MIVLDQNGGEILMGQGDMLFLPPGSSKLVRSQGCFISDEELRRIVQHCKAQRGQNFHPELVKMPGAGTGSATERDELRSKIRGLSHEVGQLHRDGRKDEATELQAESRALGQEEQQLDARAPTRRGRSLCLDHNEK